jgi:hypothetical protein
MIPYNKNFDLDSQREQWINDNKHICISPYKEFHYRKSHKNPCCFYQNNDTFDGSMTSTVKTNIESMKLDSNCKQCHRQEQRGQLSGRQRELLELPTQELIDFLTIKKVKDFSSTFMFSNKCNMSCRMCDGNLSSLYDKTWNKVDRPYATISDNNEYWEIIKNDIKSQVDNYETYRLNIMGGEGTIQEDLYKLTDWLIKEKLSQKIYLELGTNGSVFLKEAYSDWCKNFKQVSFALSIDSVADNYYYARWPVKFDKIKDNLQNFAELEKSFTNCNYYLTPTFYVNNIAYLTDWLDFFENFYSDKTQCHIFDNTLNKPNYLAVINLPTYIKQQLCSTIEPVLEQYSILEKNSVFKRSIASLVDQLKNNLEEPEHGQMYQSSIWKEYLETTAKWDKLTKTSIAIHNKKLWDLFSDEDKNLYFKYQSMVIE